MSIKYKTYRKGQLAYGFGPAGFRGAEYIKTLGFPHQGIDWVQGFGSDVFADNAGLVYKVHRFETSPDGWQAVWMLVPYSDHFMEVCYGHLSEVFVKEGQKIKEDQLIGKEGNFGHVYSNGARITKAQQAAGDKRGSHNHEQFRPVRPVLRVNANRHYLRNRDGSRFRDDLGRFYEVIYTNDMKGCIDPLAFTTPKGTSKSTKIDWLAVALKAKGDEDHDTVSRFAQLLRGLGL
jgi:hypothetical protein